MKFKFELRKDKLVCNRLTLSSIEFMRRILNEYVHDRISFTKLRELNPLYSIEFQGRPNDILCGPGIYYVINHSYNRICYEAATSTDKVFWEIYNNPGPYQKSNSVNSISYLKSLANKAIAELDKSYSKYNCDA